MAVMVTSSAGGWKGTLSSVVTAMRREKSFSSTVTAVTGRRGVEGKKEGEEDERGEVRNRDSAVGGMRVVTVRAAGCTAVDIGL